MRILITGITGYIGSHLARALLPDTITEGTKLHYEYMEYTVVE